MTDLDKMIAIVTKHYGQWEQNPSRMENGYKYESTFASMAQAMEKEMLEASLGTMPISRNDKKKTVTRFGTIDVPKSHVLIRSIGNLQISALAQETMCRFGQSVVFEEASSLINNLTGCNFNAKQVERVCHLYGGLLEQKLEEVIESGEPKMYSEEEKQELHYAMIDGAMYPTKSKEEPWKEVKLGRLFKNSDLLPFSEKRNFILKSTYVAHLGEAKDFFPKFEYEVESLKNLVFINDGGSWIWKWVESSFPNSIQILDFYHAKEHLCEFAKEYFKEEQQRKKWIENQTETLLNKTPEEVVEAIKSLPYQKKTEDRKTKLINYYTTHLKRMQYKSFKEKGLLIGSGAIESAHRVYQQRFKLSGQHWTKKGLQETMQLKSAFESKLWDKVLDIARDAA